MFAELGAFWYVARYFAELFVSCFEADCMFAMLDVIEG